MHVLLRAHKTFSHIPFSTPLKKDIVDIEKLKEYVHLVLMQMTFQDDISARIILFYYTLKICINNKWCLIRI